MAEPSMFEFPGVESKVRDTTVRFRCVSARALFKLKGLAEPVLQAIAVLFEDDKGDEGHTTRDISTDSGTEKQTIKEFTLQSANPEVLKFRAERKERVIKALMTEAVNEKNLLIICEIIHDSVKKDQPEWVDFKTPQTIMELEAPVLLALAMGTAKANKELFDPFMAPLEARLGKQFPAAAAKARELAGTEAVAAAPAAAEAATTG